MILQVFYVLFSSIMLSLAIPNEFFLTGSAFIAFFAICPYYLAVKKIRTFREAFWLGFLQTITTHLISSFWLAYFKDYAIFTLGASAFGTGLEGGLFGLFFHLPYHSENQQNNINLYNTRHSARIPFRVFYFAAVYTVYEWFKSTGFLGYPWGTVSSCMFNAHFLMQISAITGTYGVTFLTIYFSALISEGFSLLPLINSCPNKKIILFQYKISASFWIVTFVITMIYGFFQYSIKRTPEKILTSILVQQNADPWKLKTDRDSILLSQKLTSEKIQELEEDGKKADLIVWSEGCLRATFPSAATRYKDYPTEKPLVDFIKENQIPLIAGGSVLKSYNGKSDYYNSALVFDKDGNYRGYYAKNHLVPFAEVIPFREFPIVENFLRKVVGISAGWTPGEQYTYFDIPCKFFGKEKVPAVRSINLLEDYKIQQKNENNPPTVKISIPICFDDSFTDICRPLFLNGSEIFINITDDSWSLKKSSEYQHFVIASYRAIEYRTTLVRSTNAGVTSVIDPAGKILAMLPLFEETSMSYDVPIFNRKMTTYAKFGNWFPYSLGIFINLYLLCKIYTFKKSDYIPSVKIFKKKKSKKHRKHESHKEKSKKKHKK